MEGKYKIIGEIVAFDGPVRSLSIGPIGEVLCGSQSNDPTVKRYMLSYDKCIDGLELKYDETGDPIHHDKWVTAVTSQAAGVNPVVPDGCIITGCMDNNIRVYDSIGNPISMLSGHEKGIISFSWIQGFLISGSWDGTARVWDLSTNRCMYVLQGHENGVHVLGLPNGQIATTSTGEAINNKPQNFFLRIWNLPSSHTSSSSSSSSVPSVAKKISDHEGPVRSISHMLDANGSYVGIATTSNDGTIKLRSYDGDVISTLYHPNPNNDIPMILDSAPVLYKPAGDMSDSGTAASHVSCSEDGLVVVWEGVEAVQAINHPSTVWCVLPLPDTNGDFITGCHDGAIRIFSKDEVKTMNTNSFQLQMQFVTLVDESVRKKRKGPSSEEIEKAAKWDDRGSYPGTSEGQVMVFNKNGAMIAAQWSAVSAVWIEIGVVTGNSDGGIVNGVEYDHVKPVEIETANGLVSLSLGYNNLESPYDAAQRFIDQNSLSQNYLKQIADWIVQSSDQATPTIDNAQSTATTATTTTTTTTMQSSVPVSYKYIPMTAAVVYDSVPAGFKSKILPKINDLNSTCSATSQLSSTDTNGIIDVLSVLEDTSHYHSSTIQKGCIDGIFKMILQWDNAKQFPGFDILRLVSIHSSGARVLASHQHLYSIFDSIVVSVMDATSSTTTTLTSLRFLCNCFKHEELKVKLLKWNRLYDLTNAISLHQSTSKDKTVRVALTTFYMNVAHSSLLLTDNGEGILTNVIATLNVLFNNEQDAADVVLRSLIAIGTLYMRNNKSRAIAASMVLFNQDVRSRLTVTFSSDVVSCYDEVVSLFQ